MDSDFRRPRTQKQSSEPLDTHIPRQESYETRAPESTYFSTDTSQVKPSPIQDIKPVGPPGDRMPPVEGYDSPAPQAAPAAPVASSNRPQRPTLAARRAPRVVPKADAVNGPHNVSVSPQGDSLDDAVGGVQGAGDHNTGSKPAKKGGAWKWVLGVLAVIIVALAVAGFMAYRWYDGNLAAVDPESTEEVRVTVSEGEFAADIANNLYDAGLIKNLRAFNFYYRLNGSDDGMKVGVYMIGKNQGVEDIVTKLEKGDTDEFPLTFLPGGTIFDAKQVMLDVGYDEAEIDAALYADYDYPVLSSRPAGESVEGYIFGETYNFFSGATAEDVISRTIQELQDYVVANDIEAKFAEKGFNMHEGLSFASLVQTEVGNSDEMRQVSSVFHNRLDIDMELGSDVTFRYAAKLLDEPVAVNIDSPYNTRVYKGLPPGPVAAPGVDAIEATVNPVDEEYLFFVSGDDGVTYFSRTNEEHERLTAEHCDANCRVNM